MNSLSNIKNMYAVKYKYFTTGCTTNFIVYLYKLIMYIIGKLQFFQKELKLITSY